MLQKNKINFKPSNPGTATVPKYRSVVQNDGDIILKKDGVRYLHDEIQSYEEQCNINNLVRRFQNGDVNALGSVQGVYADISKFPTTKAAALQSVLDAQAFFESLPADLKQQFGNSWEQFYVSDESAVRAVLASFYGIKEQPVSDPAPSEAEKV